MMHKKILFVAAAFMYIKKFLGKCFESTTIQIECPLKGTDGAIKKEEEEEEEGLAFFLHPYFGVR